MPRAQPRPRPASVLTRALLQAARRLALTQKDLAHILGISEASASRLSRGRTIDPGSKEGELALLLLRLFRSLDAQMGGDEEGARRWLHAPNNHLHGAPAALIGSVTGLVHVTEYLDAMRGRI